MSHIEWISRRGFQAARCYPTDSQHHGHSFLVSACSSVSDLSMLREALHDVCQSLDYQDLSLRLPLPDDQSVLQFIRENLEQRLSTACDLSLRSAPDCGVEYTAGRYTRWLSSEFSAAHFLPNVPEGHQCGRLHGHGFKVRLCVDAHITQVELNDAWQPIHAQLNHAHLNHIKGLENPTSENLCDWLWQNLRTTLPDLSAVEIWETHTAGARRDEYGWHIWKERYFEAAVPFDAKGQYTGHSYLLRVFLSGTPDSVSGWLRDFAEVKATLDPHYQRLDHYALDMVNDLNTYDCAHIAAWLGQRLSLTLPELSRIEIFENDYDGARWSCV